MDMKGHAAVVTGGASGLGAATAAELARAGRALDDRRQELGRELGEAVGSRLGEGGSCSQEQRNGEEEGQG